MSQRELIIGFFANQLSGKAFVRPLCLFFFFGSRNQGLLGSRFYNNRFFWADSVFVGSFKGHIDQMTNLGSAFNRYNIRLVLTHLGNVFIDIAIANHWRFVGFLQAFHIAKFCFRAEGNNEFEDRGFLAGDSFQISGTIRVDVFLFQNLGVNIAKHQIDGFFKNGNLSNMVYNHRIGCLAWTKAWDASALSNLACSFPFKTFQGFLLKFGLDTDLMIISKSLLSFQYIPLCLIMKWGKRGSNPHASPHMILSHACLPIPALPLERIIICEQS